MATVKTKVYKMMANPNPYSKHTCCADGCGMRSATNSFSEIRMFSFPRNPIRRRRWELATGKANWKSHHGSRLCSKHFIMGRPSSDPNNPDYVPSIFVFKKNAQNLRSLSRNGKSRTRRKLPTDRSCANPACRNSSSNEGKGVITSCGIKGFCSKCFSSESVSSAFSQSLKPLNQTLTKVMLKLTDMEEEKEQLRQELALCRGEIHQLREAHQDCSTHSPSTSMYSMPNKSVSNPSTSAAAVTEMLQSLYSDESDEVHDPDLLPTQYLEQIYHQPDEASKGKRQSKKKQSKGIHSGEVMGILQQCRSPKQSKKKQCKRKESKEILSDEAMGILEQCQSPKKKRVESSNQELKDASDSPKEGKSSDTGSQITIIYLKP